MIMRFPCFASALASGAESLRRVGGRFEFPADPGENYIR
jgi:hypothetical protein